MIGYGKALTAFTAYCLVFFLGILGIVQVPLQLTAMPLRTSVTDVRRFEKRKTMLLFKIRADLVAGFHTSATVLTILHFARSTDVLLMGAGFAMQAWIE